MGKNTYLIAGLVTLGLAILCIIVGFATPYWLESDPGQETTTKFERIGLWEACFRGYTDYRDSLGRVYTGCNWLFAREYDAIRSWLIPGWFVGTQGLTTVCVVLILCVAMATLLVLLGCISGHSAGTYTTIVMSMINFLIGIFIVVALIIFGSNADRSQAWLKKPQSRHLSWSFYVMGLGGVLAFITSMLYLVHFLVIRKERTPINYRYEVGRTAYRY